MNKKILCFFIMLSFLFIQLSCINLFAADYTNDLYKNNDVNDDVKDAIIYDGLSDSYNVDNIGKSLKQYLLENQDELQNYTKEYYKQQLNEEQQNVYNTLKSNLSPDNTNEFEIKLINPITFSSKTSTLTEEEKAVLSQKITALTQPALDALIKDNPEIFWLEISRCIYSYSYSSDSYTSDGITWKVDKLIFKPANISDSSSSKRQLDDKLKEFNVEGSTIYDKLKSIHDQLANLVTYDLEAPRAHEAIGALADGKAVCEGYAKAFKLLCDKENIPCVLVVGESVTDTGSEGHMWNYVKMENNNWYAVDVTWDDQTTIEYDYFLSGSDTRSSEGFGGSLFKESHIESGDFSGTMIKYFSYPAINIYAYAESIPVEILFEIKNDTSENVTNINYGQVLNLYASLKDAPYAKGKLQFKHNGNDFGSLFDVDNAFISIDGKNFPFLDCGLHEFNVEYIPHENGDIYSSSISNSISVTVNKYLGGIVSITGDEVFGETITAIVETDSNIPLKYVWKRQKNGIDTIIEGENKNTYKINSVEDIGAKLIVEVTSDEYDGMLTASTSSMVIKANGNNVADIPKEKIENNYITYTISFDEIDGAEWSINKIDWQDSSVFMNIQPNTTKTFYVRMKETDTAYEGNILEIRNIYFPKIQSEIIKTDYNIEGIEGNRTLEVITFPQITGMLYKFGNDEWSTQNIKSFEKDDIVNIKVKYPETETHFASSEISFDVNLSKLKQEAPDNFNMVVEQNDNWQTFTVMIPEVEGAEYSFDGINFNKQNTKTNCLAGSNIIGYIRFPEKDGYNQSAIVLSKIAVPEINGAIDVTDIAYFNNKLVLNVTNKSEKTKTAVFVICLYDENNKISDVIRENKKFVSGNNKQEFIVNSINGGKIKIMLWNNLNDMVPIINFIEQAS